jgi:hypothetical protein
LAATLQHLADSAATLHESGARAEQLEAAHELQIRVMVRSKLDGFPIEELQERYPGMERFLEQVRSLHSDEAQARLLAAHAMALQFGWGLMAPTLRAAFGLNNLSDGEIRQAVADQITKIIAPQ